MEKVSMTPISFGCLFLFFLAMNCKANNTDMYKVTALYVFGDSNFDVGNNDNLNIEVKSNYLPYGIDVPGIKGGRYSNGFKIPDFYAQWLNLQSPPPYLKVDINSSVTLEGFNYASGSSGILNETHFRNSENLPLGKQVTLFRETVEKYLPKHFKDKTKLANYLSKSIFLIAAGANDINLPSIINRSNTTVDDNPIQFSEKLINQLSIYIQEFYQLGARKFVIYELRPACNPTTTNPETVALCNDVRDKVFLDYNGMLASKIQQLKNTLHGSTFVHARVYNIIRDIVSNPRTYGFEDSGRPCCQEKEGYCIKTREPCKDRSKFVFFDGGHFTQAMYKILAKKCFDEIGYCIPMNIKELAQL